MTWYQILTIVISTLSLFGFGVVAKLYWEEKFRRKREQSEEYIKLKKQETQDAYREVIRQELDPVKKDLRETKSGIQAELRHDIRNACRRCIKQGWKTLEDLEEVISMHDNYERLGSNGKTNALFDEFMKLPTRAHDNDHGGHEAK